MTVWAVLKNIGTVIALFRSVAELVGFVAKNKAMPAPYQIRELISHLRKLLDRGAIDIKGVDEAAVSDALRQISDELCKNGKCELPKGA